jgi:PAS domain-containing protein
MLIAPGHVDEVRLILDRIRRGERIERYETERQHKDGHIIAISLTVSPIRDDAGRVIGASKIARDITEAKREHAALLEREAQLRSILDTIPDGGAIEGSLPGSRNPLKSMAGGCVAPWRRACVPSQRADLALDSHAVFRSVF